MYTMNVNVLDGEFVPYLGKAMERNPEIDNMEELLIAAIELWEEEHSQEKKEEEEGEREKQEHYQEADKTKNEGGTRDEE